MSYRLIKKEQRPGDVVSFKDIKMTKSMLKHSTAEYQRPQAHCKNTIVLIKDILYIETALMHVSSQSVFFHIPLNLFSASMLAFVR